MPNNAKIYSCFIASPSDTQREREVCDEVFKSVNEKLGEKLGFRIEGRKWEKNARPSFGEDGQDVINKQLLDDYQMFIGLMWNKFGSPTKRSGSGTEEEFDIAYKKHLERGDVEIMIYFNEEPVSASNLDIDQLAKVKEFRSKVSDLGGLYWTYDGPSDFADKLERHLSDFFIGKLSEESGDIELIGQSKVIKDRAQKEAGLLIYRSRLEEALCLFSNQPVVWIEPVVSNTNAISMNSDENYDNRIDLKDVVANPKSVFIKSPPQFGLTCLGHSLCYEAWKNEKLWIYIDFQKLGRTGIDKVVKKELRNLNMEGHRVDCFILDSWITNQPGARRCLRDLCNNFKVTPVIVLETIADSRFISGDEDVKLPRDFSHYHLLAPPRSELRKVISEYNRVKGIGEEDAVVDRIMKDMSVLNAHRTPQNCITLLKVAERHFEESPVNRTKMLEMLLIILFDLGRLPQYTTSPDVKDCEYILGRFCEKMLRESKYIFTREEFLSELTLYCSEKLFELEVGLVFDILYQNSILVSTGSEYEFRSTYWIYYFAAQRMYVSKEFCAYILSEKPYPEIIEFYTGIDRNRGELIEMLSEKLAETSDLVESKTGLPKDLNPLKNASWDPSQESISKIQEELGSDVQSSSLPDSVKDKFSDKDYNQLRPYDQSVNSIMLEYSLVALKSQISACSRALRNSDYVDADLKQELLRQITRGWHNWSKIIFALSPLLAVEGRASFDGQGFELAGDFGSTTEERLSNVMTSNPVNVVSQYKDDLFSPKIGPLIYKQIEDEDNELVRHLLILMVANTRTLGWRKVVERYIDALPTSSFYLYDLVNTLRMSYQYAFADDNEVGDMSFLIKKSLAKHKFKSKLPKPKEISRVKNSALPERKPPNVA